MSPESETVKGAIPLGEDIMQIARIGEVSVMQKLFDTKKFSANFKDDEEITPLHVCAWPLMRQILFDTDSMDLFIFSGRPSIINMRCANSCSTRGPM